MDPIDGKTQEDEAKDKAAKLAAEDDADDFDLQSIEGQEFDTTLKEIAFTLKGQPYKLREMSGLLRDQYNTQLYGEYMERQGDRYVTKKYDGFYAILLIRSIVGPDGKYISFDEACNLPAGLQIKLYLAARKISCLDTKKAKADAAKNS